MNRWIAFFSAAGVLTCLSGFAAKDVIVCRPDVAPSHTTFTKQPDVDVFWDISRTMRHFIGGKKKPGPMNVLVETLDSAVLPRADAQKIHHIAIGDKLADMPNALGALSATADWTALHDAAVRAGADLAARNVGAVIFVSDMKLEISGDQRKNGGLVCGRSMPTSPKAGAYFGPCLSTGFSSTRFDNLYASTFQACGKGQCLYVVVIATNVTLGREVTARMGEVWKPRIANLQQELIADTLASQESVASSGQCTWKLSENPDLRRSEQAQAGQCLLRCDGDRPSLMHCTVREYDDRNAWLKVKLGARRSLEESKKFAHTVNPGKDGFDLSIVCPEEGKWRTAGTEIKYDWVSSVPDTISVDDDVRRLFESLLETIQQRVPVRETRLTFSIR